jgi:hypothetical protein
MHSLCSGLDAPVNRRASITIVDMTIAYIWASTKETADHATVSPCILSDTL